MTGLFPSLDPGRKMGGGSRRRRMVPFRTIIPNLVTLLALCAGLSSIPLAMQGRFDLAIWAILVAAILDGIDGRVARLLKSTSAFGAQLDSLADFVNFGVAPALLLYIWVLNELGPIGWTSSCLVYAICAAMRLARFNVALEGEPLPDWQKDYFIGVPSPAGAIVVLFPLALDRSGFATADYPIVIAAYTVIVGLLMVSRLPTYSGKRTGAFIPGESVMPLFVVVVVLAGFLASYTFQTLAIGTALYIAHIPFAWRTWRRQKARDAAASQQASDAAAKT